VCVCVRARVCVMKFEGVYRCEVGVEVGVCRSMVYVGVWCM
jgi:hypothetical protein